ncbi:carbohydrate ABC transporter permease [Ruminococcaceae bacterium OttesenSCG-928-A11]|nr:carbohydrate ABC transporter permease [Ruminococcaceae bacterium OttesenSCG-928-A11]
MVIKESRGDKVFNVIVYIVLAIILVVVAYPLWFVLMASISDPDAVNSGRMILFPKGITFEGYKYVFQNAEIMTGYRNTLFYTVLGTSLNLVVTLPAAYALSRRDFFGNKFFTFMFLFTMYFSGGLIPTYMLITQTLHMDNTIWVMIIPGATSMTNIIICRTFFRSNIPDEMREAAEIDGCSNVRMFFSIVLPLSAAIIAVMALFFGIVHWNSYFNAMMYISPNNKELYPLQLVMRDMLLQTQYMVTQLMEGGELGDWIELQRRVNLMKYGLIVVASVPVLVIYPFVQKYFVKGVMVGAVKG